jgi:hypothetical protein
VQSQGIAYTTDFRGLTAVRKNKAKNRNKKNAIFLEANTFIYFYSRGKVGGMQEFC